MALSAIAAAGLSATQTPSSATRTDKWPRYSEPFFALLAPIDGVRRKTPPRDVLAELDKLQAQIAASPTAVQAWAQFIRAETLRAAGDAAAAEVAATQAWSLGVKSGHPFLQFDSLVLRFNLANDRGDLEAAASRLAEALPIAELVGDGLMKFTVRYQQGRLSVVRGRGVEGVAQLSEAVAIATAINAHYPRVQALMARSSARLGIGEYDAALADAQLGYELGRSLSTMANRAATTYALAQVVSQIGDLEAGLELYTDAIDEYTKGNFAIGVSVAVRQRMDVHFALQDYDAAAADGERARELFATTGSTGQEPAVLSRLALIEARRGRPDAAVAYAQQAVARVEKMAQPRVRMQVESDLASAALVRKDFADAAARYGRVLEQGRLLRDPDLQWRALHGQGRAALGRSDAAAAETHFNAAIAVIENVRRTLPEAGQRADFVAERLGPYDGLIDTLMSRSTAPGDEWAARAFEISERARGRALADLLAEARARLTQPAVAKVRAEEATFGKRLSDLQAALADAKTDAERTKLVAALERAEREYDALVVRIRRETPQYGALAHPRALTAPEIAKTLAADEALVSFWIGSDQGTAWVLAREGLRAYRLPGRRDLDRDVRRLRSSIAGGQSDEVTRIGATLHETLFRSLDYARIKRLIVVPDGPLWRAPLAALHTRAVADQWLIQRAAISVVPSASLLSALTASAGAQARAAAVVFGLEQVPDTVRSLRALYDPRLLPERPLPYAAAEARAVARWSAADPAKDLYLNDRADETSFKRAIATPHRVLHVASHALIDDRVPRRSALILASSDTDDGLLQLNEIANLQVEVDLVVLSTCQSQLGRAVRGEGLVSLSRAFLHGGARAVTASLWAVDDRETSRLMPFFYAALKGGAAPDEALRVAQLQMIKSGGSSAVPSSWAGFVITGRANRAIF